MAVDSLHEYECSSFVFECCVDFGDGDGGVLGDELHGLGFCQPCGGGGLDA